jgi:S-adenosylmethionine hydrolase
MGRPIGFLTDLGLVDDAVGTCKGLMLSISPDSAIYDVTHAVPPFDVYEGASYLADAPEFFPANAVFAAVVYPETGAAPTIAARNSRGQILVAPDNGLLTLAAENYEFTEVYIVENPEVMRMPLSPSFYGRDVVAAAAAHLAAGVPLENVGTAVDDIRRLPLQPAHRTADGLVVGQVSLIDKNFGNVWTNIPESLCRQGGLVYGEHLTVRLGDESHVFPLLPTFADVAIGERLAFFNSRGKLAFALNQRNLLQVLPLAKGVAVEVERFLADSEFEADLVVESGGQA